MIRYHLYSSAILFLDWSDRGGTAGEKRLLDKVMLRCWICWGILWMAGWFICNFWRCCNRDDFTSSVIIYKKFSVGEISSNNKDRSTGNGNTFGPFLGIAALFYFFRLSRFCGCLV